MTYLLPVHTPPPPPPPDTHCPRIPSSSAHLLLHTSPSSTPPPHPHSTAHAPAPLAQGTSPAGSARSRARPRWRLCNRRSVVGLTRTRACREGLAVYMDAAACPLMHMPCIASTSVWNRGLASASPAPNASLLGAPSYQPTNQLTNHHPPRAPRPLCRSPTSTTTRPAPRSSSVRGCFWGGGGGGGGGWNWIWGARYGGRVPQCFGFHACATIHALNNSSSTPLPITHTTRLGPPHPSP